MIFETEMPTCTKECSKCKNTKPVSDFYKMPSGIYGVAGECKRCNNKRSDNYRRSNMRRVKHLQLLRDYGMSIEEYENMLISQDFKCMLCGKHSDSTDKGLYVDHCHSTGVVRGLLCGRCNLAIGMFNDDAALLEKAAEYITIFKN